MPITLPVEARPDERSFNRVADHAEKRFQQAGKEAGQSFSKALDDAVSKADPKAADRWVKAYDKVADATGKVRVEEAKLADLRNRGASETRLIAQSEALERARRAETRAVRDAGAAYDGLSAKASGALGTLSNLTSGTRFGGMISDVEMLAGKFGGIGLAVGGTITAVAGLAVGIGAAGAKLYEMGAMWDDVADRITARTGKIGTDLEAVMDQVTSVAMDSSSSIAEIGDVAGRVSASLGLTGEELGNMTAYLTDLNELMGEQTNVRQLGMLFQVFGIQASDQIDTLNQLYTSFTKTQIPVNELISLLVNAGPKVQQFGLDIQQTSALLAAFAEAGVEPEKMITGLQTALGKLAKQGKDPAQGLSDIITKLRELTTAGKDVEATTLAVETFGRGNASSFLQAVQSGKVGAQQLSAAQKQVTLDIRETKGATDDLSQEWQRFTNFLEINLKPIATSVFSALNDQLERFTRETQASIEAIKQAWSGLKSAFSAPPALNIPGAPGVPAIVAPPSGGAAVAPPRGTAAGPGPLASLFGIPPKASGGIAGRTGAGMLFGPGTGTSDSILGVDPFTGLPTAWVSAGEGIVKASSMRRPGVAQLVAGLNGYAGGTGGVISEIDWVAQIARQFGLELTSGLRNEPGSLHSMGWAGDFSNQSRMGPSTPQMQAFATFMSQNFGGVLSELIHESPNFAGNIKNGRLVGPMGPGQVYNEGQAGYHGDHVHVALKPGALAALNAMGDGTNLKPQNGGLPVWIMGAEPTAAGRGTAAGGSRTGTLTGQLTGGMGGLGGQQLGAPIAPDFGLSQGLPGLAENLTNFLGNMAFAPVLGALSGVSSAMDPTGRGAGGGGLLGMLGALGMGSQQTAGAGYGAGTPMGGSTLGLFGGSPAAGLMPGGMGSLMSGGLGGMAGGLTSGLAGGLGGMMGGMMGGMPGMGMPGMAPGMPTGLGLPGAAMAMGQPATPGMPGPGMGAPGGPPGGAPGSTVGGIAPGGGPGGPGFGGMSGSTGLGGQAMSLLQQGIGMAGMALDTQIPGAGTAASIAAQIGVQELNRAIAQGGKAAGLLTGGLMETFLPAESKLGDPNANWFGRIAAGFAGARPALPNMASQSADKPVQDNKGANPVDQAGKDNTMQVGQAANQGNNGINVTYNNFQATEDRAGADLTNHLLSMASTPMAAGVV